MNQRFLPIVIICLGVMFFLDRIGQFPMERGWAVILFVLAIGFIVQDVKGYSGWILLAIAVLNGAQNWTNIHLAYLEYIWPVILVSTGISRLVVPRTT
jgi:hypothetical protein